MSTTQRFGFWTLTFLVIANMIRAGVFTTSGFALLDLGTPHLVVAAWVVAGLIALAGAASYGQLVRAMPESGGEYVFLSRAVHPLLGYIAGWVSLIAGFTGAIAFAATTFESYVLPGSSRPSWLPVDALAVGVVVLSGLFHGFRPRVGAFFQNSTVLFKLGFLVLFLTLAGSKLTGDNWHGGPLESAATLSGWPLALAFGSSLIWISLSYSGFNAAVYVAEEAKDVQRTIPMALVLGTLTVMVLYVLLNAVFVYAPPPTAIAENPAEVAAVAAEWLGGTGLAKFVRAIISLALLTSVSSMMMAAPRVYGKMADDGLLPSILRSRGGTPRISTAVQVILASALILASTLQGLLQYLGLTLSLTAACSVSCLLLPKVRVKPLLHANSILPVVYVVGTLVPATLMTINSPRQLGATALTFSVGALAYFIATKANGKPLRPAAG